MISAPINFSKWIADNRHLLIPPVGNKVVYQDDNFIIMAVGGPNERSDYHYNETEEFFYQIEGEMVLKIIDEGKFRDIPMKAGEIFLLPPKTPHSPQRSAGGVGLVIEVKRRAEHTDGLIWYCDKCRLKLYEEYFKLTDIEKQFPPVFDRFYQKENSTCKNCGHQHTRQG